MNYNAYVLISENVTTYLMLYSYNLININQLQSIHDISLHIYMVLPNNVCLHLYRACLPTKHHP